ncbi:protein of unknown function [Candidatus Hydrogenisulfobacillus filiaventi]|uniref:Uncharacterized protein n=1 Tax=Candidatus Hydrogenisulfobacillus filiaventi TaxID=2707344 RepID=A0A6F8ZID6_9FIRM|nr:protein of unknown function [Candidatus Hydrogenisulfobacillus filiaventi]CAB1129441.1 protein of unknown function [Candidatus Hydrogenisulfobacillus filiaventi]
METLRWIVVVGGHIVAACPSEAAARVVESAWRRTHPELIPVALPLPSPVRVEPSLDRRREEEEDWGFDR